MNKTCPLFFALVAAFAAVGDSLDNIGEVRLKGPLGARLDERGRQEVDREAGEARLVQRHAGGGGYKRAFIA